MSIQTQILCCSSFLSVSLLRTLKFAYYLLSLLLSKIIAFSYAAYVGASNKMYQNWLKILVLSQGQSVCKSLSNLHSRKWSSLPL